MTDLETGLNFWVHCGGSPVRGVGMASDRNGVKSPPRVIFYMAFKYCKNNTPVGGGKDDQTVSKENQLMLEFINSINVLKNDIKNYGQ